jgi:hypothetical protein
MATYKVVAGIGTAVAKFLDLTFQQDSSQPNSSWNGSDLVGKLHFQLVSSSQLETEDSQPLDKVVSLFLHRITLNDHQRGPAQLPSSPTRRSILNLDLHYLITYWGTDPSDEQLVLAWVMQQLQMNPILDRSLLPDDLQVSADETMQITPSNLSLEDIMRIWDAIGPKYRLSLAYNVRAVRIDVDQNAGQPVVGRRYQYESMVEA